MYIQCLRPNKVELSLAVSNDVQREHLIWYSVSLWVLGIRDQLVKQHY